MAHVKAPYYNYSDVVEVAKKFSAKYHPKNSYPVPIEEIIEFKLGMDIIPIPGLHKAFNTDGFLSSDLRSISVDLDLSNNRPGRYRFTLAHEVGHAILHSDFYKQNKFDNIDQWKKFLNSFPEDQYGYFEYHANSFAGLILVPSEHLEKRFQYWTSNIRKKGINDNDVTLDVTIKLLADDFLVSSEVICRRLYKDGLAKKSR